MMQFMTHVHLEEVWGYVPPKSTGWSILSSGTTRPGQLSAVPAAHNNVHHTTQLA